MAPERGTENICGRTRRGYLLPEMAPKKERDLMEEEMTESEQVQGKAKERKLPAMEKGKIEGIR